MKYQGIKLDNLTNHFYHIHETYLQIDNIGITKKEMNYFYNLIGALTKLESKINKKIFLSKKGDELTKIVWNWKYIITSIINNKSLSELREEWEKNKAKEILPKPAHNCEDSS